MTNRKSRRAEKATPKAQAPGPTKIPNLSGDERACGNCFFSVHATPRMYGAFVISQRLHNQPLPPEDETLCLHSPEATGKKRWGFCHQWVGVLPSVEGEGGGV